ncbi:beta strand repeat-containing protein [Chthonobacter rhizosphaerae]|uniref:beta strand repeat-containing protein n=1 Tax=Chthonobacter rhizosphaerae TaxID=2735553 RepID=UPI0015EEF7B1|nr:MBG domain-containing protein [Chthonobacter rhizosphaerae]
MLPRLGLRLLLSTALVGSGSTPAFAQQVPQGGSLAAGSASIASSAENAMTITQTSSNAVLNWQSFSIGQGASVTVAQPSSSSALVNRVTGGATSTIAGRLAANGRVYLINPNGITLTPTGTVSAGGGFVASSLDIADGDFMAGRRSFSGKGGRVVNRGAITVGRGGYAALIGGEVDNAGTITVPLGRVGLGSGKRVTLDLAGDGFLQVEAPVEDGAVSNSGRLSADGGSVEMKASAARDAARTVVNMSGIIEARTVSGRSGKVVLGGDGGTVAVSGAIRASAGPVAAATPLPRPRPAAGSVIITGDDIALTGAQIDVSGPSGGGSVRIGGDYQGRGELQRARTVAIDKASVIDASALEAGSGGRVIVWSDVRTEFAGAIRARGGARSGDGGFAEVSGKALLGYTGLADFSAPAGRFGTLLLDPYNVVISNGAQTTGGGFAATGTDSVINAATLGTQLQSANVTVTTGGAGSPGPQAGDITVAAPVAWTAATTLTLSAFRNIAIDAPITASGGGRLALHYGQGAVSAGNTARYTVSAPVTLTAGQTFSTRLGHDGAVTTYQVITSLGAAGSTTGEDLQGMRGNLARHYALGADIDASATAAWNGGAGFNPVGNFTNRFNGSFDGLGHTIRGLTINRPGQSNVGLFGATGVGSAIRTVGLVGGMARGEIFVGGLVGLNDGTVSNSYATDAVTGSEGVGGLVGANRGTVSSSHATGAVGGTTDLGGLVGLNDGGTVSNSYATGAVTGSAGVGGLVGANDRGTVSNSYATGAVTATTEVGGLVGTNDGGTVSNSYATGAVGGATYLGGLVGLNDGGTVSNSYATGAVTGSDGVGGLVGLNLGTVSSSYATGGVGATTEVGGLVGANLGTVSSSYATGAVGGTAEVGGLVGANLGTVSSSYATGAVGGATGLGGLVGLNVGTVSSSYATGAVNGTHYVGGLVGANDGTVSSSFWNTLTSGRTTSDGGTGLNTAQMRDPFTFIDAGWDFINEWGKSTTGANDGSMMLRGVSTGLFDDYVRLSGNTSRIYGDPNPSLSGLGIDRVGAGTVTVGWGSAITGASRVGTYAYADPNVLSVAEASGRSVYTDYGTGTLTVTPRDLLVTARNATKIYGETLAFDGTEFTADGLINGDTITGVTLSSAGAAATATVRAGGYGIAAADAQGTGLGNYTTRYASGTLTVTPRDLLVTARNATKIYGETLAFGGTEFTADGLVNGDTITGVTLSSAGAAATATVRAGGYGIAAADAQGTGLGNYTTRYASGTLTLTPRDLLVTARNATKIYGERLAFGGKAFTADGLVNGDIITGVTLSSAGAAATATVRGGPYAIAAADAQGTGLGNYTTRYASGTLTVTPRPITVSAGPAVRRHGTPNPPLRFRVVAGSLVNGDGFTGALASMADAGSPVGTYRIQRGSLTAGDNYDLTYLPGTLTVIAPTDPSQLTPDLAAWIIDSRWPPVALEPDGGDAPAPNGLFLKTPMAKCGMDRVWPCLVTEGN